MASRPISLYIHVPFCPSKCYYCSFLSFSASNDIRKQYVQALLHEIEKKKDMLQEYQVQTLYGGGGCPTLVTIADWKKIMDTLRSIVSFSSHLEWTMEVNPATVDEAYLVSLSKMGVNRLSFGIQSFDPQVRLLSGRKGNIEDADHLISRAVAMGFQTIGIDLIMGLPGQTFEIFREDLSRALSFSPQHLSLYFLSIEPGTVFHRQNKTLSFPSEQNMILLYQYACSYLRRMGYRHYEVSNWAQQGSMCRHNMNYWEQGEYIGLGLGAHSFLNGKRFHNTAHMQRYLAGDHRGSSRSLQLSPEDRYAEYMLLSLRTKQGIRYAVVAQRFGEHYVSALQKKVEHSLYRQYLHRGKKGISLTEEGFLFLDAIILDLL
jgi:oxygen-independent coproporphyrinogen-3 oxidase